MAIIDRIKQAFSKKEEMYTPQREAIDRRHDALQRQLSYYEKKAEIPVMEAKVKAQEKEVYGNSFRTKDEHNIVKVPNHFKGDDGPRRVRQVNPKATTREVVNRPAYTPKYAVSQRLRPDRLAARELRVKEMKAKYARLRKADKVKANIQRKIARILQEQKKERMQTEQQYRASYGAAPTQNDGNILHVPNMFGSAQAQQQVQNTGGNILGAQNLLLRPAQARVGSIRQKWL
jgi:hypothetical protein